MNLTRRDFIAGVGTAGMAAVLSGPQQAHGMAEQPARGKHGSGKPFSFVHLTDQHITTRRHGAEGYRKCIESINALRPRPAFVLMGGDMVFDGLYTAKDNFEEQIRLYRTISDELDMPYYHCMGNHDVLGLSARRKVPITDPDLGKKMIMDRLEWPESYYSFDVGGWHFVVLDCIHIIEGKDGPTYEPRIGPEQLEWLAYDLGAAAGRPTIAVTHVAAFCNVGQLNGDPAYKAMDGHMVLWDTRELRTVFERHKVKALLQGHSHCPEDFRYNDVWYVTSPAASAAWWAGAWTGAEPGYTVVTCDKDEFDWQGVYYGWEAQLDPQDELERNRNAERAAFAAEQQRLLEKERAGRK